jgi:hypothetical protein
LELKKKMDAARKSSVRRGPVARKRPAKATPVEAASPSDVNHSDIAKAVVDGSGYEAPRTDDYLSRTGVPSSRYSHFPDVELLARNIADPMFYDDCIVSQTCQEDVDCERSDDPKLSGAKKSTEQKFRTWGERHPSTYRHVSVGRSPRRVISSGTLLMRKSTDEFKSELEKMERLERENALKATEKASGDDH